MPDQDSLDAGRMGMALALATRGWGQTAPNPMVGAVIYRGDEQVGAGFHAGFGKPHAEAEAIAAAGERARGATLYVNLEPCCHHGRNPPCTDAIIAAGIARVVAATRDPNPAASGGAEQLSSAGVAVSFGVREAEARELNAAFFHNVTSRAPWVTLKLAVSLDGAIADAGRTRRWLTGEESRAEVQRLRANSDAVAVGIATAIADDPQLLARSEPAPRIQPVRVVFDRSARLPASSVLARTARDVPVILVTASGTRLGLDLQRLGVEAITAHDMREALDKLADRGVRSLLVEGGAGLAASFLAGGYAHRMILFSAPVVLGDGALGAFSGVAGHEVRHAPRFTLLSTRAVGNDVMSTYAMAAA